MVPCSRNFSLLCSDKDCILSLEVIKLCLFTFMFLIQPEIYFVYNINEGTNFIFFYIDNQLFQHFQCISHSCPQWFVKISLSYIKFLYMLGVSVLHCCFCFCFNNINIWWVLSTLLLEESDSSWLLFGMSLPCAF